MTSVRESTSVSLRNKGNLKYKTALAERVNIELKKDMFLDSIKLYQKAYNTASNSDELASAAKNIATASLRVAHIQTYFGERRAVVQHFYKQALTHFSRAIKHGEECKSLEWLVCLGDTLKTCIEMAIDSNNDLPYRQRIGPLEEFINCIHVNEIKAVCFVRMASDLFKEAITELNVNGYKKALHVLKECYRPTEEARRLAGTEDEEVTQYILCECRVLEEDCFLQLCIAESIQARNIGDELLEKATKEEEELNMTLILEILDWYKRAIIQTHENDVEQEAIALSRLGYVYDKVLKNKYKAQENYHRCVQLALSMHPRTFNSDGWYKEATAVLQKYQEEKMKQEELKWYRQREKFVEEASMELSNIKKEFGKGDKVFIQYIYKEFPPKKEEQKLGDVKVKSMKSLLKTALTHYHPDKQNEHGGKWIVICEEICKLLTQRYESYKGDD